MSIRAISDVGAVNFLSWNVKGLNSPVKRNKVFSHIHQLKADIMFLQETHLKATDHQRLHRNWIGQQFHSKFHSKARGVAILIRNTVQFSPSSILEDPYGRYVIVSGLLYSTKVTLANIYAPNWDDHNFVSKIISLLPDLNTYELILGGDFNCVLDTKLDRSSPKPAHTSLTAKTIQAFLEDFAISDAWRFSFPTSHQYSFFSHVHHSYSRIDYFFIDQKLLSKIKSCSYESITISDHAPLLLTLLFPGKRFTLKTWRLNTLLLSDSDYTRYLSSDIGLFLETNSTPDISPCSVWEALKAYVRGRVISYSSFISKRRKSRLLELSTDILTVDKQYAVSPNPELYRKRITLQTEYNLLSTNQATQLLQKTRQTYFEFGDKPSKLLALQLRQRYSQNLISQIRSPDLGVTSNTSDINTCFNNFYKSLYQSESTADQSLVNSFLNTLPTPSINQDIKSRLDEPLSLDEVTQAIRSMQSNKSPGPDGFPIEFYKTFGDALAKPMLNMFNEALNIGLLPQSLRQASISLILKKDKDPLECGSYRPISLCPVDAKVLAKALARRLESILPQLIHSDQTGFIKNRMSFFNIRRVMNTIHTASTPGAKEILVLLDAEKAFDRVEWDFLFATLRRFGFGERFIAWVKLLYTSPLASVRTNDISSPYFELQRGTRQGCPLSPLLFALSIKPLAIAIRSDVKISGITRGGIEQKISLYADDVILYLSNPATSLPRVLHCLEQFGAISGYKLNISKSELFPLNIASEALPRSATVFKLAKNEFKYLGVKITRKFTDMYKKNFISTLERTKLDFSRWSSLPLTLMGRVSSVKMNVLPKFLYLFQAIPIFIPKSFFKSLDQIISSFIWNKGPARIRKSLLQKPKTSGGLALPNFQVYYWSANIHRILYWLHCHYGLSDWVPTWVKLEEALCRPMSLEALACAPLPMPSLKPDCGPVVSQSLRIWKQFKRCYGIKAISIFSPCNNNPAFPPSLHDDAFEVWRRKGIAVFKDLYIDKTFASFAQLSLNFQLPKTHLFRYFQIRDFVQKNFKGFPAAPTETLLDRILQTNPHNKGVISSLYARIIDSAPPEDLSVRQQWEIDMGYKFDDEDWTEVLNRIHSSSICARHSLIQLKFIHRVYWTKARLSKINPDIDPICDRCRQAPATLMHMFWLCPTLITFWKSIFSSISKALNINPPIDPSPSVALLNLPPTNIPLSKRQKDALAFATLIAKRSILMAWKSPQPPSHVHWMRDLMNCIHLEKIRYTRRNKTEQFQFTWGPFISLFSSLSSTELTPLLVS